MSEAVIPVTEQDQSLVRRLRALANEYGFGAPAEAADRIEALEQTIWTIHGEAHEHIKCIEALEKRWDLQVDDAVRMAAERISQLEAALREIADYGAMKVNERRNMSMDALALAGLARRALEG